METEIWRRRSEALRKQLSRRNHKDRSGPGVPMEHYGLSLPGCKEKIVISTEMIANEKLAHRMAMVRADCLQNAPAEPPQLDAPPCSNPGMTSKRSRSGCQPGYINSGAKTVTLKLQAGWPTQSRHAPPIILPVAVRIRIESTHSLELTPFRQARSASASSSSTSNSSSATATSAEGKDGVKRRRKGPGSVSFPSFASAQGRRRQRPEMVSSMINFSGPLGQLPPAPPGCCILTE
jgi:hypothetical protein